MIMDHRNIQYKIELKFLKRRVQSMRVFGIIASIGLAVIIVCLI